MTAIAGCLDKLKGYFSKDDRDAIVVAYRAHIAKGVAPSEAARRAVRTHLADAEGELKDVMGAIAKAQGRPLEAPRPSFTLTAGDRQGDLFGQQRDLFDAADKEIGAALDKLPMRADNNAKARTAREGAIRELTQAGRLNVLAASLNTELLREGKVDLIGQKVTSLADLAAVAQVYRDPRFETLRYIMVKDGKVVHENAVTSRLPASTSGWTGKDAGDYLAGLREQAKQSGASQVYVLHNHPSGHANPSDADLKFTEYIAHRLGDLFAGHVVIDTDEYATIDMGIEKNTLNDVLKVQLHKGANFGGKEPHNFANPAIGGQASDVLGALVDMPGSVAQLGARLKQPGYVSIIAASSKGEVVGLAEIPASSLANAATNMRLKATLSRFSRATGAGGGVFLAGVPTEQSDHAGFLVRAGYLRDAVGADGTSARARLQSQGGYISPWQYMGRQQSSIPARQVHADAETYSTTDLFGNAHAVTIERKKKIRTVAPAMADLFEQAPPAKRTESSHLDLFGQATYTAAKGATNESERAVRGEGEKEPQGNEPQAALGLGGEGGARNLPPETQRPGVRGGEGVEGQPHPPRGESGNGADHGGQPSDARPGVVPRQRTGPRPRAYKPEVRPGTNFTITRPEEFGIGGWRQKYRDNVAAIRTLRTIEAEARLATPAEQEVLARFVGWGGLKNAFFTGHAGSLKSDLEEGPIRPNHPGEIGQAEDWAKERRELVKELSAEEYEGARASTPNAHYTAPQVIKGMWDALAHLGFREGRVLEPSMGVGHFYGLMPEAMRNASTLAGVELDPLAGRIAKQLYQTADVRAGEGFERAQFPSNFFDLAISNVPFGDYQVSDPKLDKFKLNIHNYFFAKALDRVRPGGVVAFITSSYTMDSQNSHARATIARLGGDLIGAVRLPNDAFKKNAGTEVTTDIIFLKKRAPGEAPGGEKWEGTDLIKSPQGSINVNDYFKAHPEMMLGKMTRLGTMYGGNEPALKSDGRDLGKALAEAVQRLPADTFKPVEKPKAFEPPTAPDAMKPGALIVKDGRVFQKTAGMLQLHADLEPARVQAMIDVRDVLRAHLQGQLESGSLETFRDSAKKLNDAYDAFVAKHGAFNDARNEKMVWLDADGPLMASIERWDPDTKTAKKGDVFTQRTVSGFRPVTQVETPLEALSVSLNERGRVDVDHMAQISGLSQAELIGGLRGRIFHDPISREWESAEGYLAGNVRTKLREAESAARTDPRYQDNVDALKAVQPVDLAPALIRARLGQVWMPQGTVEDFANETFKIRQRYGAGVDVALSPVTGDWKVTGSGFNSSSPEMTKIWGTDRMNAVQALEYALNQQKPTYWHYHKDGSKTKNVEATLAAAEKIDAIRGEFESWWQREPERAGTLAKLYNEALNTVRLRQYDGGHLTLPGTNPTIKLRANVKDGAWRIVSSGHTLLAHAVGAGKTFTMVSASMELRRLGLARKPLHVVPNHMLEQYSREWLQLYPNANVLLAPKAELGTPEGRKLFTAKVATGNWDGVVITHSSFEKIPMSPAYQQKYVRERIRELEEAILEGQANKDDPRLLKRLEKRKANAQAKLNRLLALGKKDDVLTFEQMGVDHLFVDEAHEFKNLEFMTKMERIAGVSGASSQKATDLFLKTQYMDEINNGKRGVVFATGTPIANSVSEMFTMQRYLGMRALKEANLDQFDNWAAQFGEAVTQWEMRADGGGYAPKTRFAKFVNVGELAQQFGRFADIKTAEMLKLPVPEVEGGHGLPITAPRTAAMDALVAELVARAEAIKSGGVDPRMDNMLKITNDGRNAALDMRLIDPKAPDDPNSKVNQAVKEIHAIWADSRANRSTQLVFSDLSTPKGGKQFSVYDDIRAKLIAKGVPSKEIAFIQTAKSDAAKETLFQAVRDGSVRVLLGSTKKMGTGTNVQTRLLALHHLDVPWRPADLEQRNGRIVRAPNMNAMVKIKHYITEGSFDAFMWGTVERKAGFIAQAMRADPTIREIEDVDARAMTYAELKAVATGNPMILEKAQVEGNLQRLTGAQARHQSTQSELAQQAVRAEQQGAALEAYAKAADFDQKALVETRGDAFRAVIGGKPYGDRVEAANALSIAINRAPSGEHGSVITTPVGTLGGMDVAVARTKLILTSTPHTRLVVEGRNTYQADAGEAIDGNLQRLENLVRSIAGEGDRARRELDEIRKTAMSAREGAAKPFDKTAEIETLRTRLAEIDRELGIGKDDAQAAVADEQPDVETADPATVEMPPSPYRTEPDAAKDAQYAKAWQDEQPPPLEAPFFPWGRRETNPPPNAAGTRERAGERTPTEPSEEARHSAFGYTMYEGVVEQKGSLRRSILDSFKKLFQPSARGAFAKLQAGIMRANLGRMARDAEVAHVDFERYARAFSKLSQADQVAFTNRYERGETQPTQPLREAADAMRAFNNELRQQLQALGKLEEFNENYLGRIWLDPEARVSSVFARRPLEGSKNFLKRRVYEYFSEGLAAGLKPITYNPVEMMLLKGVEQRRFIYAHKIMGEMREAGLIRQVPYDGHGPDGWSALDDKLGRSPQGRLFAPDEAATLFNNHLSPGLRGNSAYDAFHKAGMMLNSAQLGLSFFHAGFTTLDAMVSKAALGVQQISRGQFLRGFGSVVQSLNPAQPFINAYKGDRLLRAYLGQLNDPSLAPIVQALVQGGGRVRMDEFYRNATLNAFKQALNRNDKLGVAKAVLPSLLDRINAPIFEQLVPRQKLGVFFDLAKDWLERNPEATLEQKREAMGKVWDSVDNRMGQLAYDNVFWNRTLKDMLMLSVRSVGWNLGTFRELGGGVLDMGHVLRDKELSTRAAYVIALPFLTGIMGSMIGYLYTGKGPDELKDYFFPKTGRMRPDHTEDRLSLPSYMKDVYEYGHDISSFVKYGTNPTQTLQNKLHPMLGVVAQMLSNQDFFGGAIRSPGDPALVQLQDEARYLGSQLSPFSIRNYQQQAKVRQEEPSLAGYVTSPSMIGITPSPGYITKNAQQTEATTLNKLKDSLITKFREELQNGTPPGEVSKRAFAAGLRLPEITRLMREGLAQVRTVSKLAPRRTFSTE